MELTEKCQHTVTQGIQGETGSYCVDCGDKILNVETRPCKDCAHYKRLHDGSICRKLLMAVSADMLVTYYITEGSCFTSKPAK